MEKIEHRLLRRACDFFSESKHARKFVGLTVKKKQRISLILVDIKFYYPLHENYVPRV